MPIRRPSAGSSTSWSRHAGGAREVREEVGGDERLAASFARDPVGLLNERKLLGRSTRSAWTGCSTRSFTGWPWPKCRIVCFPRFEVHVHWVCIGFGRFACASRACTFTSAGSVASSATDRRREGGRLPVSRPSRKPSSRAPRRSQRSGRRIAVSIAATALFAAGLAAGLGGRGSRAGRRGRGLAATLDRGQEVPRPAGTRAGSTGRFAATLVRQGSGGTLAWRLTFGRLSGPASAAHIHLGKPGRAGPVALALCSPCRAEHAARLARARRRSCARRRARVRQRAHEAESRG